jgi:xylan 1,4-beta-xylosidase
METRTASSLRHVNLRSGTTPKFDKVWGLLLRTMRIHVRTHCVAIALFVAFGSTTLALSQTAAASQDLWVDAQATSHPFPHFWEVMFGSGRAILSLRESYRQDLRRVKEITNFKYVRFHDILDDDVGLYDEDSQGKPVYNFLYVDQIYDGLLANGVKPFVELSFMPKKLSAKPVLHAFWYKPNVAPPADYGRWGALVEALTRHLLARYGAAEVESWYFEVWNEPNIDFWAGEPKQATYWQLYDQAAQAIKKVDSKLRVGGPATAQAAWVTAFLKHCSENHVPVDFVSTHVYGNDRAQDVFATNETIPRDQMVCRAVRKVHDEILASATPRLPLIWSEFNASYKNEPEVTDAPFMGPWLADTICQCDGLASVMAYWTFSDVFDEQGVPRTLFYGGYGLIAEDGIAKPAYAAFELLHKTGEERLEIDSNFALLTRKKNGTLVLVVWNYSPPEIKGQTRTVTIHFKNSHPTRATISRVDAEHGDPHAKYQQLGSPASPTQSQLEELRKAAELPNPEVRSIQNGTMLLELPPRGLTLIEVR